MFVKIKQRDFETLGHDTLCWECIKPIVLQVRGKDFSVKSQVYAQLTKGQKALFMFRVYFNHASKSKADFYWWSTYFLSQPTWSEIKTGMQFFHDDNMLKLLTDIESILNQMNKKETVKPENSAYSNLENNPELDVKVDQLFAASMKLPR